MECVGVFYKCNTIYSACRMGCLSCCRAFVLENKGLINEKYAESLLVINIKSCPTLNVISFLLESGENPNKQNVIGETPLYIAIKKFAPIEVISELVKYGAKFRI